MPATSNSPDAYQWRESWPPSQIRLQPPAIAGDHNNNVPTMIKPEDNRDEVHLADDNPLVYFLTPTPPLLSVDEDGDSYFVDDSDSSSHYYDNDLDDDDSGFYSSTMDFEFDAGIEDATHPQPIVRSVSPSSLANGLGTGSSGGRTSRMSMRPPTPPRSRESLHPNGIVNSGDDDGENYIHFGSSGYASQPIPSAKGKATSRSSHTYLSSSPLSSSPALPRSIVDTHDLYAHHHSNNSTSHLTAAGATIVRRRSPRSWRVPSPEVFSIEEETEEELSMGVAASDRPGRSRSKSYQHYHHHHYPERNLQVEAAKPQKKKQVRFVLPGEEIA
ncbi:hypothetical protein SEUCBS139899_007831 [Sporothrix eucalyptigena]